MLIALLIGCWGLGGCRRAGEPALPIRLPVLQGGSPAAVRTTALQHRIYSYSYVYNLDGDGRQILANIRAALRTAGWLDEPDFTTKNPSDRTFWSRGFDVTLDVQPGVRLNPSTQAEYRAAGAMVTVHVPLHCAQTGEYK